MHITDKKIHILTGFKVFDQAFVNYEQIIPQHTELRYLAGGPPYITQSNYLRNFTFITQKSPLFPGISFLAKNNSQFKTKGTEFGSNNIPENNPLFHI